MDDATPVPERPPDADTALLPPALVHLADRPHLLPLIEAYVDLVQLRPELVEEFELAHPPATLGADPARVERALDWIAGRLPSP